MKTFLSLIYLCKWGNTIYGSHLTKNKTSDTGGTYGLFTYFISASIKDLRVDQTTKTKSRKSRRFKHRNLDQRYNNNNTAVVVNLSSVQLSENEISLPSKGLNFCP